MHQWAGSSQELSVVFFFIFLEPLHPFTTNLMLFSNLYPLVFTKPLS